MDAASDEELMAQVARGDRRAFATIFDRHHVSVARFAYRFVGDRARAEELAQDIFVKLYRAANGYRPTARFKTYLFRVATNHCLNEMRRGEHQTPAVAGDADGAGEEAVGAGDTPEQALWGRQLERAISEALAALSERERAAFCMCRFEGLSYREIAEALSASEAAVKSLIHRATLAVTRRIDELKSETQARRSRA